MNKILQVNCSELLTHLDIVGLGEIKKALNEIMRVTGYKVGFVNTESVMSKTPLARWHSTIPILYTYEISIDNLEIKDRSIGIPNRKVPGNQYGKSIWNYYKNEEIIPVQLYDSSGTYLYIDMKDGYCDRYGLTFKCTQHCCEADFPLLHKIICMFGSDYEAHDCGSVSDFEEWLYGKED